MGNIIHKLRESDKLLMIVIGSVVLFMIAGAISTGTSMLLGRSVIIVSIMALTYLFIFLGVDPVYKGIALLFIPLVLTYVFIQALEWVPETFYEKWLSADTVRGQGPESIFFLLMVQITVKMFNVKPYIRELLNRSD
ncbi:hypothetical protein LCL89_09815 [Halobacillus yeomjeoni]|uniref:hypothetical protein n=1 Tax=Halobacillus yeomjeoni TaxID=311194 RepID=UPI001CD62067|nr:hypothetical protein [Halobacillus yeomjeoni]MCA0984342.1 hypothetical protein [Halobacillus yeomjeoni]